MEKFSSKQMAVLSSSFLDLAESLNNNLEDNNLTYTKIQISKNLHSTSQLLDLASELNEVFIDASFSELEEVVRQIEFSIINMKKIINKVNVYEDVVSLTLRGILIGVTIKSGARIEAIGKVINEFVEEGKRVLIKKSEEIA